MNSIYNTPNTGGCPIGNTKPNNTGGCPMGNTTSSTMPSSTYNVGTDMYGLLNQMPTQMPGQIFGQMPYGGNPMMGGGMNNQRLLMEIMMLLEMKRQLQDIKHRCLNNPNPQPNPPIPPGPNPNPNPNPPSTDNITGVSNNNVFNNLSRRGITNYALGTGITAATINDLTSPINVNMKGDFTGSLTGRGVTVRRESTAQGNVHAIVHAFVGRVGSPNNITGTTPEVNIDLGAPSTTADSHKLVVIAGKGNINMQGGDIIIANPRDNRGGNITDATVNITNARNVRIAIARGEAQPRIVSQNGNTVTYMDGRGCRYVVNADARVVGEVLDTNGNGSTVSPQSQGRRWDIDTAAHFGTGKRIAQEAGAPHRTVITVPNAGTITTEINPIEGANANQANAARSLAGQGLSANEMSARTGLPTSSFMS